MLTSRDLIIFRSSHSRAQINGAIYSQLLVMNFLNSAFCEKKKKKSKYLNCLISCSFSWHASFWFAFKNKLENHDLFRYEKIRWRAMRTLIFNGHLAREPVSIVNPN